MSSRVRSHDQRLSSFVRLHALGIFVALLGTPAVLHAEPPAPETPLVKPPDGARRAAAAVPGGRQWRAGRRGGDRHDLADRGRQRGRAHQRRGAGARSRRSAGGDALAVPPRPSGWRADRQPRSAPVSLRTARRAARPAGGRTGSPTGTRVGDAADLVSAARRARRCRWPSRCPRRRRRPSRRPPRRRRARPRSTSPCSAAARPPSRGASDFQIRVGELAAVPRANASELLKLAPGHPADERGRRGPRRAGLPARLRRARGAGHRVHRRRRAHQRERQPPRQRLRRHALHHPRAGRVAARASRGRSIRARATTPSPGSADYELGLDAARAHRQATRPAASDTQRVLVTVGPAGREHAHLRRRRDLHDRRLRPEPRRRSAARRWASTRGASARRAPTASRRRRYATHFHTAGVIREDDYESGQDRLLRQLRSCRASRARRCPRAATPRATRSPPTSRRHPGDTTLSQQVFLIKRDMRLLENFTGFLLDVQEPLQTPARPARRHARPQRPRADHRRARLRARCTATLSASARSSSSATSRAATRRRRRSSASRPRPASRTRPTPTSTRSSATSASTATRTCAPLRWLVAARRRARRPLHLRRPQQLRRAERRAPLDHEPAHRPELPHPAGLRAPARARPA